MQTLHKIQSNPTTKWSKNLKLLVYLKFAKQNYCSFHQSFCLLLNTSVLLKVFRNSGMAHNFKLLIELTVIIHIPPIEAHHLYIIPRIKYHFGSFGNLCRDKLHLMMMDASSLLFLILLILVNYLFIFTTISQ